MKKRSQDVKTGARLRNRRIEKGIKAYWVADQIGIDNTLLSMLENGRRHWTPELVEAYEKALGE